MDKTAAVSPNGLQGANSQLKRREEGEERRREGRGRRGNCSLKLGREGEGRVSFGKERRKGATKGRKGKGKKHGGIPLQDR